MAMKYDPTAYETWRQNFELRQSLAWFAGFAWYLIWGDLFGATGATLGCALTCACMGLYKFGPATRRFHMTLKLAGTPLPFIDFDDLRRIVNDPVHKDDLWLGRGFAWGPTQTQRVSDLLKRDWHRTYKEALGAIYVLRFVRKHLFLCLFRPFEALRSYKEIQKRVSEDQGQFWLHGVGDSDEDIFQKISHTEGHTLIIGTTGSGKTRCFDLLISQAILRGETVFIIDPKGDQDLREKARRACNELGRGDKFVSFHPAFPNESIRINLLANWTKPSEIADRIAALIPSVSGSDPFKNFSVRALNAICNALCSTYEAPTLKNLKHYLAGTGTGAVARLVIKVLNQHLRNAHPQDIRSLEQCLSALRKKDPETIAMALVQYYQTEGPADSDIDDLVSMFCHNREHFGKMITSVLPILSMLTSGTLGDMLSPPDTLAEQSEHTWRDTKDLIERNAVVYVGLDSLSQATVGQAIGGMFLSDLASVAGARYNYSELCPMFDDRNSWERFLSKIPFIGKKYQLKPRQQTVNIFVDEAAEVVNQSFLQILNKGRGARLKLFVATQTYADFVSKMGSRDKATQLLGNLNNRICLRCVDPETQKFVTESLPKTKIMSIQRSHGLSTTAYEPVPRGGNLSERLAEEEVPLFAPELLNMLPNLEFIASLSGGHIVKGRYPIIVKDKSEIRSRS